MLAVAPEMGLEVSGEFPRYHWKEGELPEAATVKVVVSPLLIETEAGCVVMAGGMRTVTVAVFEFALPAGLLARTQ